MARYLVTVSTVKMEELIVEADSRDEVDYLVSSGVGQTSHAWSYTPLIEMIEEMDA